MVRRKIEIGGLPLPPRGLVLCVDLGGAEARKSHLELPEAKDGKNWLFFVAPPSTLTRCSDAVPHRCFEAASLHPFLTWIFTRCNTYDLFLHKRTRRRLQVEILKYWRFAPDLGCSQAAGIFQFSIADTSSLVPPFVRSNHPTTAEHTARLFGVIRMESGPQRRHNYLLTNRVLPTAVSPRHAVGLSRTSPTLTDHIKQIRRHARKGTPDLLGKLCMRTAEFTD